MLGQYLTNSSFTYQINKKLEPIHETAGGTAGAAEKQHLLKLLTGTMIM